MAGMVVQHNLNAINANNKMNINVSGTKKATEKLSSGYQINRAGDNAAGLAISERCVHRSVVFHRLQRMPTTVSLLSRQLKAA